MKDPDRDMSKLGNLNDLNTACSRVSETVLDPDFYVSTTEQVFYFLFFYAPRATGFFWYVHRAPRTDDLYVSTTDSQYEYK
jgi:hypothetical protein